MVKPESPTTLTPEQTSQRALGQLLERQLGRVTLTLRLDMFEFDLRLARRFFQQLHQIPGYENTQAVERIKGYFFTPDGLITDAVFIYNQHTEAEVLNHTQVRAALALVLARPLQRR